jgi:hypothetical protein
MVGSIADHDEDCQNALMPEPYLPPSHFLRAIIDEEVPIGTTGLAAENLHRLIAMTCDEEPANRDWATLLLAQTEIDTEAVRSALLRALQDECDAVRAEALLGLAMRDPGLALPFAKAALAAASASMPVFEAVELIADPSLIPDLEPWLEPSEHDYVDKCARSAMAACLRNASPFSNTKDMRGGEEE